MDFAALACADSATTASAILVVDTAIPGCTVPITILTAGGIPIPESVTFAPVDFESQTMEEGDRDAYAHSVRVPGNEPQGTTIIPATVLIFRDQHQKEIQNYAIVGQTLWNFAPQHPEKIPLSDLDLAATAKANDERGLTFRVPGSNEAQ